jgi:rfaE bifunctional protein nucleotidyltransferase chain/domain
LRRRPEREELPEEPKGKVIARSRARELFGALRARGKRIVFTNGCFDILHAGHARYLSAAAALGDVLVVGVNGDASVRRLKGEGRPVQRQGDRAYLLASLASVAYVVVFGEDTPERLIRDVNPHVLVKGADWKGKEIAGGAFVRSGGGEVRFLPFLAGRSTTSIIEKARRAD